MSASSQTTMLPPTPRLLYGALAAVVLVIVCVGAVIALGGGGSHVSNAVARKKLATLVPDPEASSSFPVSAAAAAAHGNAKAPSAAALAAGIAPGAPSDQQVEQEVAEMDQIQHSETKKPGAGSISTVTGALSEPANVPEVIQQVIAGGNAIADFPYVYGGGHASFISDAYDCSGSVSYALAAGGLLSAPETSGQLESWGVAGKGRWITVYANAGHTFMDVDGVWFDTAGRSGPYGSRWMLPQPSLAGYVVRHWPGL